MDIVIKRLGDADPLTLHVASSDTIETVQSSIQEHLGVDPSAQRLIFCKVPLQSDKTLEDYNIGIHWALGPGPIGPTHLLGPRARALSGSF